MVEVIGTQEFDEWFMRLTDEDTESVMYAVDRLESRGLSLGYPQSSDVTGSRYALRELPIQSHGRPLRVFYAFDPRRQAIVLLGADKAGQSDKQFYRYWIPRVEAIWE
ncbi:MAG: type II toxin-antitoxin system RelE/ParE family toxin [Candidatus Binatia bacterium]